MQSLLGVMLETSRKHDLEQKEPEFFGLLMSVVEQYNNHADIEPPVLLILGFSWSKIAQKYKVTTDIRQQLAASNPRPKARKISSKEVLESVATRFVEKYKKTQGIVEWLAKEFDTTPGTVRRAAKDYRVDLRHFVLKD